MLKYRIVNGKAVLEGFTTSAAHHLTDREIAARLRMWIAPILVACIMSVASLPLVTRTTNFPQAASVITSSTGGLIQWLLRRWRWHREEPFPDRVTVGWTSS